MGTGVSVFLLALGAILTFAVETDSAEGININSVGIILMIAGALGLVMFAAVFGRRDRVAGRTTVIEQPPVVERRRVVEQAVVQRPVVEERIVEQPPVVQRRVYE